VRGGDDLYGVKAALFPVVLGEKSNVTSTVELNGKFRMLCLVPSLSLLLDKRVKPGDEARVKVLFGF